MQAMIPRFFVLVCLLLAAGLVLAQDAPEPPRAEESVPTEGQSEASAGEPGTQPVVEQPPSLRQAYQREFAFLQGQKADLERRLSAFTASAEQERDRLQADIEALERELIDLVGQADRLEDQVFEAERSVEAAGENVNLLAATFQQAEVTVDSYQAPAFGGDSLPGEADVQALFGAVAGELDQRGRIRSEAGEFFLADGTRVSGRIVHVGRIASYGISERGAGVLAPAGEGELKLWNETSAEAARALAAGETVSPLPIFIYENLRTEVEQAVSRGLFGKVAQGGAIGWVIFALGLVALLLVVLRGIFLWSAGRSTGRVVDRVEDHVRRRDLDSALNVLDSRQGATARVVATAIRNLDRDREHLEDIVSEAILHESSHLNRLGAFIMVIAAVAPLLGLLGTVTGMISTFDVITEFGTGDPKLLSGGISIALVTTEMGLIVAIPTLLLGTLLSSWAERIKDDMEQAALRVSNQYSEAREPGQPAPV
ncbi:MAG: MotA/TolQ/ExbB proton channel family protein [Wenzhouxiangella sp.]|jgi:biopolymer transport protein ExbB|nr:MotA/TolQ/ExbB proton channel family protein [Wenzhouxiangella sp.]